MSHQEWAKMWDPTTIITFDPKCMVERLKIE